jgi:hypothetical protein
MRRLWRVISRELARRVGKEDTLPLTKNWFPSLVKNLAPLVEIVGMACTKLAKRPRRKMSSMCAPGVVLEPGKRVCRQRVTSGAVSV